MRGDAGHRKGRATRSESSEKTQAPSPLGRVGGRQQALEMTRIAPGSTCRLASYPTRPRGDPYGSLSSRFGIIPIRRPNFIPVDPVDGGTAPLPCRRWRSGNGTAVVRASAGTTLRQGERGPGLGRSLPICGNINPGICPSIGKNCGPEASQPPAFTAPVTALETKKYMLVRLLLSNSIDPTMASTTRPSIREYSIAVAPLSSFRNMTRSLPIPRDFPNPCPR